MAEPSYKELKVHLAALEKQVTGRSRVVTIENFGVQAPESVEPAGWIYEGDAWLFRFRIQSLDHFFQAELDNLVSNVLDIDSRQIYHMVLYRLGRGFAYDVRLYISFEKPPEESKLDQLQLAVPLYKPSEYENDSLSHLFYKVLRAAKPVVKRKLLKALESEQRHAPKANESN